VPFPAASNIYVQNYDFRSPYSQTWNLGIQQQIGTDWIVSASYVGSNTLHATALVAINPAIYFPGGPCTLNGVTYTTCSTTSNTEARRRFTLERPADGEKLGFVAEADTGGTQVYSGLLLSVERRAARGVTVNGNYTWSHCIGDDLGLYSSGAGADPTNTSIKPFDRGAERGNCESDRRHLFNMTTVAETPQFSSPVLRVVAAGWRLSGIYKWSSGAPIRILAGSDRALNGTAVGRGVGDQRANQVLANPYLDTSGRPGSRFLNRDAFALPDLGTIGSIGRNSIQGPARWSFDAALSRVFRFRETQRMEFRAEAYNVTNSFRVGGNPNNVVTNSQFGVIRTSDTPRILQFALKYIF
jgi:hypothetical protein